MKAKGEINFDKRENASIFTSAKFIIGKVYVAFINRYVMVKNKTGVV